MSADQDKKRAEELAELELEFRVKQKFTLEAAIGRLAGVGAMKGVSPVPLLKQAEHRLAVWLTNHLVDSGGELKVVLLRDVMGCERMLYNFEQPLSVLAACCQQVLDSDYLLKELVRNADVEWGRIMGERPYFEQEGSPHNPSDPYTIESVRIHLLRLLTKLAADNESGL